MHVRYRAISMGRSRRDLLVLGDSGLSLDGLIAMRRRRRGLMLGTVGGWKSSNIENGVERRFIGFRSKQKATNDELRPGRAVLRVYNLPITLRCEDLPHFSTLSGEELQRGRLKRPPTSRLYVHLPGSPSPARPPVRLTCQRLAGRVLRFGKSQCSSKRSRHSKTVLLQTTPVVCSVSCSVHQFTTPSPSSPTVLRPAQ